MQTIKSCFCATNSHFTERGKDRGKITRNLKSVNYKNQSCRKLAAQAEIKKEHNSLVGFKKVCWGRGGWVLMVSEALPLPQFLPFFIEWNIGGSGGQKGMAQQKHREKRNTERKET